MFGFRLEVGLILGDSWPLWHVAGSPVWRERASSAPIPLAWCPMRIATWNVNSIRQRLPHLLAYLKEAQPDVVCLQEIKCLDEPFPREEIEALGYNVAVAWAEDVQRRRHPVQAAVRRRDARAAGRRERRAGALYRGGRPGRGRRGARRVASICPTAIPSDTEKYPYKLAFMERLMRYTRERLNCEEPLVLAGDYNVIPTPPTRTIPTAGSTTRCSCRRRGRTSARCSISA